MKGKSSREVSFKKTKTKNLVMMIYSPFEMSRVLISAPANRHTQLAVRALRSSASVFFPPSPSDDGLVRSIFALIGPLRPTCFSSGPFSQQTAHCLSVAFVRPALFQRNKTTGYQSTLNINIYLNPDLILKCGQAHSVFTTVMHSL